MDCSSDLDGAKTQLSTTEGRVVTRDPGELRLHPVYVRHQLTVDVYELSVVAELGDLAYREPLLITRERIILDRFALWALARQHGRTTLTCIEYEMSEIEALQYIVQRHRRSRGLNSFSRIRLALELEPFLRTRARANQRSGGRNKGSSNLTKARNLDVRKEIARIAGVSVGNVTKSKQIISTGDPSIIKAVQGGEMTINRAWSLAKNPKLRLDLNGQGIDKTIRQLITAQVSRKWSILTDLGDLSGIAPALQTLEIGSVKVLSIKVPGRFVLLTEDLARTLKAAAGETLTCATKTL
jgi:hypothetical protein